VLTVAWHDGEQRLAPAGASTSPRRAVPAVPPRAWFAEAAVSAAMRDGCVPLSLPSGRRPVAWEAGAYGAEAGATEDTAAFGSPDDTAVLNASFSSVHLRGSSDGPAAAAGAGGAATAFVPPTVASIAAQLAELAAGL
jgi:hypothetical protein